MTRAQCHSDTSVIIAGAGPLGLGLACEFGLLGVDCMLVEKRDGTLAVPKQSMVSARNMEFCRRWGVAETVRRAVWPEGHPLDFVYLENLRGRELLRVKIPSYTARDARDFTPESPCPCPQIYFDPILVARVKTFANVKLHYNTRLDAFSQDADGVTAQLTDVTTGATQTVRATTSSAATDRPGASVRRSTSGSAGSAWWRAASTSSSARRRWQRSTTRAGRASTA